MSRIGPRAASWGGLLAVLLALSGLACNFPRESIPNNLPWAARATPVSATPTAPAALDSRDATPLTPTPELVSAPAGAPSGPATVAASGSCEPLAFTWEVLAWEPAPGETDRVIATLYVAASGGNGVFAYFHDDLRQPGPVFAVTGSLCRPLSHRIRVDSAGDSVSQEYWIPAPCPEQ